jgi:hypothetical protein
MSSRLWLTTITQFFASLEKHTGLAGFEGLVVRLFEGATGQRFRLAGSGSQGGLDARSESGYGNRIKIEAKHYLKTSLKSPDLIAKISEAASFGSDVDLWVLATSSQVNNQLATMLEQLASERNIEILLLDCGNDGLPRFVVMMAALPEIVEDWIKQNNISFPIPELIAALQQVANDQTFQRSWTAILAKLKSTLLGYESGRQRSRNQFLATMRDEGTAEAKLAQRVAMHSPQVKKIPRLGIQNQLNTWWTSSLSAPKHAVVLGEEGIGKTWAVMGWIADQIQSAIMPIVLPFSATAESISNGETIESFLPKLLEKWTGFPNQVWSERLRRWLADPSTEKPFFLIVADGLNEKPTINWPSFFRTLKDKYWRGHVAVLITDRSGHWGPACAQAGLDSFYEIDIRGYTDGELQQILQGRNISLQSIPRDLHELITNPRYCDLVCEHFDEIKKTADFTRERLIFLDVLHRTRQKRGALTEDAFVEIIKNLAKRYRQDPTIPLSDIHKLLPVGDPEGRIYQEIIDGGLLVRQPGLQPRFRVEHTRLVFGLGMLFADQVRSDCEKGGSGIHIQSAISQWFEPEREMDLKVEICGAALFHSLIDLTYPSVGRGELLRYWLTLRNRNDTAQQAFADYVVRCPEEFIAAAEEFWLWERDHGAAQDFLASAFVKHRDDPRLQGKLATAINRWMGFIHAAGHPFFRSDPDQEKRDKKAREEIKERIGFALEPGPIELFDEKLTVIENDGLLRLKRLGFRIISAGAIRPFAHCLISWALASAVMGPVLEGDIADWMVHLADDDFEDILFPKTEKLLQQGNLTAARAARTLLWWLDSKRAEELWQKDPDPTYVYLQEKHESDPCTSLLPWSDRECLLCMERKDVSVHMILNGIKKRPFDPQYAIPESLIQRTREVLGIPGVKFRVGLWPTVEDHAVETAIPILASRLPNALAEFIRHVVASAPERNAENLYALAIWLPEVTLLFNKTEIDTISLLSQQLQASVESSEGRMQIGPGKDSNVEAFVFLALAPHLTSTELFQRLLHRPKAGTDLKRFEAWFDDLPHEETKAALNVLHSDADDLTIMRALWFLGGMEVDLTDADRDRIVSLADSESARVRGGAMRFAALTNDEELGRRIVALSTTYQFDGSSWDSVWGPEVTIQYSTHLTFESLASQLHPAELGYALANRGFSRDDISKYAEVLNVHWERITSATDPNVPRLPSIIAPPNHIVSGQRFPEFFDDERTSVSFQNPTLTWRALSPEDSSRENFLGELTDAKAAAEKQNHLSRQRVDALKAAWRTDALQWFGRNFSREALAHVHQQFPDLVMQWVRPAVYDSRTARTIRARLGTFLVQICSILLDCSLSLGLELWEALRTDQRGPMIFNAAYAAFVAADNQFSHQARVSILRECHDDAALAEFAQIAEQTGHQAWLLSIIEQLISEKRVWKRAKGLALASYSNIKVEQFDGYIAQARMADTWMEPQLEFLRHNILRNEFAQHWFQVFLEASDKDVSWGALQILLACGDQRVFIWRSRYENGTLLQHARRVRYLNMQESQLEKELDRERERKETFLGVKIQRGEIFPFVNS